MQRIAEVQLCVDIESLYCNFKFEFSAVCRNAVELPVDFRKLDSEFRLFTRPSTLTLVH
jgi:hypothetical protein